MPSLIGTKSNQVPTVGDLGTLAFQDANAVNIQGGVVNVSAGTAALPTLGTVGDPNTGVFFPAADTVAVSTNGVERTRIDSSGNVGIGNSSPSNVLTVTRNLNTTTRIAVTNSDTTNTTSRASVQATSGAVSVDATAITGLGGFMGTSTNHPLELITNGNGRVTIDTSGNVKFAGSISVGGATPTTSGTGITFPATQSASSNANTLDDYEEGTWTPALQFGFASTGITYATQLGTYTKIGNLVQARFTIVLSSKGAATGNATVDGLPFTANAGGSAATIFASNFAANAPQIGYAGGSTNYVVLTAFNASGTVINVNTDFANNTRIDMWVEYFV
jgi:hypothetical protein